jgi:hypothetical protein
VQVRDAIGGDPARQDRVERDAVGRELLGERLERGEQPGPVRVRQHQRRDRLARGGRRHAHDPAEAALAHPGHHSLDHLDRSHHELAVRRLPLLAGELERVAAGRAAGVGHEQLDRPEVALDALEQLGRGVEVERVVHVGTGADAGGRGLDPLARPRAHRDAGALARELAGDREADSLRRARYERDLPVKPEIHAGSVSARGHGAAPVTRMGDIAKQPRRRCAWMYDF